MITSQVFYYVDEPYCLFPLSISVYIVLFYDLSFSGWFVW